MKKVLASLLMAVCMASSASNGPFDGIYANPNDSKSYITVMQSGSIVISTAYTTIPAIGVVNLTPAGVFSLARSDIWDLFFGTIVGNVALISGEIYYGACKLDRKLTFDSSGVYVYDSFVATTALGASQNMQCGHFPFGPPVRYPKLF